MATTEAVIYLRISRDSEGEGLGVARREAACREKAVALGWTVTEVYSDNDISAYSGRVRPAYRRLLADMDSGKVEAVVAWHTDRLHRSPIELEAYASISEAKGIPTHTVQSGHLDLTTPSGRMIARILGATARYESEHKAKRVREKHEQLRDSGDMVGARSFGFALDERGELTNDHDPVEAELIRDAADYLLKGGSPFHLAKRWNELGHRTTKGGLWTHSNLKIMLCNPKVAGFVPHGKRIHRDAEGNPVRGKWEPILELNTWLALVSVFEKKKHGRSGKRKHLLTGIAKCDACEAPMHGSKVTRPTHGANPSFTYQCSNNACRTGVAQGRIEPEVLSAVAEAVLYGPQMAQEAPEVTNALHARLATLRASDARVLDSIAEGVFTVSEAASKRASIKTQIHDVEDAINSEIAQHVDDAFLVEVRRELWTGPVTFENAARAKETVLDGLVNMTFDPLRALIEGMVEIRVLKVGKGRSTAPRVLIRHLWAVGLNEDVANDELAFA